MKRRFLPAAVAAVLLLGVITGCSGAKRQENAGETKESTQEQTSQTEEAGSAETAEKESQDAAEEDGEFTVMDEGDSLEMFGSGSEAEDEEELLTGLHHVEIVIKDHGTLKVELDADTAPITVTNFINLAKSDFYDGLTFHRIIDGFMMQGGDPDGNGTGGSPDRIVGEFSSNGIENNISHTRGTISMARSSDPDSASSQFFIVQTDYPSLDGQYAAFGHVTEGMEIVDEICKAAGTQDRTIPAEEQPVIEDIAVID